MVQLYILSCLTNIGTHIIITAVLRWRAIARTAPCLLFELGVQSRCLHHGADILPQGCSHQPKDSWVFTTQQLLVMLGKLWSRAMWGTTVIRTKYSEWFRATEELQFYRSLPTSPVLSEPTHPGHALSQVTKSLSGPASLPCSHPLPHTIMAAAVPCQAAWPSAACATNVSTNRTSVCDWHCVGWDQGTGRARCSADSSDGK